MHTSMYRSRRQRAAGTLAVAIAVVLFLLAGCFLAGSDDDGRTLDTDGDTISDFHEGNGDVDTDGDGLPDFRDVDSDNDGRADADEAGDSDLSTAPVDSDGDGLPDFQDTDSDNDGLTDHQEFSIHHTNPYAGDSDDDGYSDLIEVETETDPLDSNSNPGNLGLLVFLSNYLSAADPAAERLSLTTPDGTPSSTVDVTATVFDDAADSVDALTAFVASVRTNTTAGFPCTPGLAVIDFDSDGTEDTFIDVPPNTTVCFDFVLCENSTVVPTASPQTFKASVHLWLDHVSDFEQQNVYFIVPPQIPGSQ